VALSNEDVLKTANLAKLAIDKKDVPAYAKELSKILEFIEQMNQMDTSNIDPVAHSSPDAIQRLREDEVTTVDQRDYFQTIAPSTEAGLYLVPIVIEDKGPEK